jgi:hypothetical protein
MSARWLLTAALILLGAASPLWAGPFTEVEPGHWSYHACARLAALDVLPAAGPTDFSGKAQLTRFEFGLAILEPLARFEEGLRALPPEAEATTRIRAAARALDIAPEQSEDEIARAFTDLARLTDEFADVLDSLDFDAAWASRALRRAADPEAIRTWRMEALTQPRGALALSPAGVPSDILNLPLAHGRVALSLTNPDQTPELLDYLARATVAANPADAQGAAAAQPALADPRISRLRTAYEYGIGSALTLNLAYEEIERRGQGLVALDAASLASVGLGYQLSRSTSVKLSYSLLEYSNFALDTPPMRDRVAETAVSIEF